LKQKRFEIQSYCLQGTANGSQFPSRFDPRQRVVVAGGRFSPRNQIPIARVPVLANTAVAPGGAKDMPGNLIYYALVLIVIAIVAAFLGFGGVAGTAMSGAHLLIWVAVVVIVVGVIFALIRRA
jgi:uncharacterized membrane protein YtjA (UPF0391 family)